MLFRYKVETCAYESLDCAFHGPGVGYKVTIQYHKPDAKLLKWRHFKVTKMNCVLNRLGHSDDDMINNIYLAKVLHEYSGIGEIMLKYIKKIMEDKNHEKLQKILENHTDNFLLTTGWNTIEFKENE